MPQAIRGTALWLLALAWPLAAQAVDSARCAATLSADEQSHLEACIARGTQCTDYWPGYPDDLQDCARAQKWLAKAIAMPEGMRLEIFGPMAEKASAPGQKPPHAPMQAQIQAPAFTPAQAAAPAGEQAAVSNPSAPAWKNLPRSQDASAPRAVAAGVAGATSANYSGASAKLDPEQARKAGLGFWTGQVVQIADTVTIADRVPTGDAPRPVSAPVPAPTPVGAPASGGVTPAAAKRELPVNYTNHPNPTNNCVELRGNTIGNKCGYDLLVTWCVAQPQQTKNFFDSSEAFECGKGGALNTIKAGSVEGNVLYGYIIYYACPYTDYYAPARMKTSFAFEGGLGLYRGTCGDGDKLSNNWTIGGTLVSRPRQ